ncbi:MAG TPA: protein kinase [Chloroflexota bacterium]|nr:protein kinase [Chloroflexota bacterium]
MGTVNPPQNAATSHPFEGRVLDGRYELQSVIGSGGMATMYKAIDRRLARSVAVKVLHQQFAGNRDFVARFEREAEFAAGLSAHPNIVSVYDVGTDGGLHYMVMEIIEGESLKDAITAYAPMSVDQAFHIAGEIASALDFAHRHGLVHRDIKPQNIIISRDGAVKVTDFGIAQSTENTQLTKAGTIMGTAHYLSPEQVHGRSAGPQSDVYALGLVLFEMLTGQPPFEADNTVALAMKHVREAPPAPTSRNRRLPSSVDAVVLRALAKDARRRYSTAAEFREALQRPHGAHEGGMVRPPKKRGWTRSHAPALFITTMVLFICGAGAYASYEKIQSLVAVRGQHSAALKKTSHTSHPVHSSHHHKAPISRPVAPSTPVPQKTVVSPAPARLQLTYIHTDNIDVPPGQATNLIYTIVDSGRQSLPVMLGATWVSDSPTRASFSDSSHDTVVTVTPGAHTYSREFQVPVSASPGSYDLVASIDTPNMSRAYGTVRIAHLFSVPAGSATDVTTTIQTPSLEAIAPAQSVLVQPPQTDEREGPARGERARQQTPGRIVSALKRHRGRNS